MQKMICVLAGAVLLSGVAGADKFELLIGVDAQKYPGIARSLPGDNGEGYPDAEDGDRLAGTSDTGVTVPFLSSGTPFLNPNHYGSLSFIFRRGTIPFGPNFIPLQGIEFLGGPLLDLDGDPNLPRTLIPSVGSSTVEIPGTSSFVELDFDLESEVVTLLNVDATTTNEGASGQSPLVTTTVVTLAGAATDGTPGEALNPGFDTRVGTVTPYSGLSESLTSVYAVEGLGFEIWLDSIDPGSSSVGDLGTLQQLGELSGWLIERDSNTGSFPTLAGEGLTTLWPSVATPPVAGIATATGPIPFVAIGIGSGTDIYSAPGNGGLALTDFGGDLGAYLDTVVVPLLDPDQTRLIYLESAGFGVNNSFDPIFGDTIGYDLVLIGAARDTCADVLPGDSNCNGAIDAADISPFIRALLNPSVWQATYTCDYLCANDLDGSGEVDASDISPFIRVLLAQ